VKLISESLGVARSQLTVRLKPAALSGRRRRVLGDAALVAEIRAEVSELPSYGYRRVWGCCVVDVKRRARRRSM
jgi:putative transposase